MRCLKMISLTVSVLLSALITATAAPQGYQQQQPQLKQYTPCSEQHFKPSLIQAQSIGRIVNRQNHLNIDHSLETAASINVPQTVQGNALINDQRPPTPAYIPLPPAQPQPHQHQPQPHQHQPQPQQHQPQPHQHQPQPQQHQPQPQQHQLQPQPYQPHPQPHQHQQPPPPQQLVQQRPPPYYRPAPLPQSLPHPQPATGPVTFGPQLFTPAASPAGQHVHHHYTVPTQSHQYASNFATQYSQGGAVGAAAIPSPNYQPPSITSSGQHFVGHSAGGYQQSSTGYADSFAHSKFANTDFGDSQLGQVIQETFASTPLDPAAQKHIYVHVPPADFEEANLKHSSGQNLPQLPPQKHYKIIFIKAPTAAATSAKQQQQLAAAQQTEEKTLIYVLVKKPDEPSVEEIQSLQQASIKHNKPEVYFIKYKTREEGERRPIITTYQGEPNAANENGFVSDGNPDAIDIRLGGESGLTSTSASYSTSSSSSSSSNSLNAHTSYGVPLN